MLPPTRKFASDHELSLEVGRQPRSAQDEEEERRKFMVRGDQATFEEWKVHSYAFESEWGALERGREGATEVDAGYGRKMSKPVLVLSVMAHLKISNCQKSIERTQAREKHLNELARGGEHDILSGRAAWGAQHAC